MSISRGSTGGNFGVAYIGLFVLYGLVGYFSPGYDDEFFNIRWVEQYGFGVVAYAQPFDVHPPGQYFTSWLLHAAFGKWELVRLVTGLITASSLVYALEALRRIYGDRSALIGFILLGLNPAILLWCATLRWYAFFVPILLWASFPPRHPDWRYWAKCCLGIFLMAHFGYIAFLLAVPLIILYWTDNPLSPMQKVKQFLPVAGVFALLYLYQLIIFFTVHLPNGGGHLTRSILEAFAGYWVAHISNQGVFPLSIPGIISSFGMLGMFFILLYRPPLSVLRASSYFVPYSVGSALLILSGFAAHFRNLVVLTPLQALWISTAKVEQGKRKAFSFFLICVLAGNLAGIYNVISHTDTVKNSWNLPVRELSGILESERAECPGELIVLTHDPVLPYYFARRGYVILGPYGGVDNILKLPDTARCLIVLKTFAGSLNNHFLSLMYAQVGSLEYESVESRRIGRDKYHAFKKKLDHRYPEFSVEVLLFKNVSNVTQLSSWLPHTPNVKGAR